MEQPRSVQGGPRARANSKFQHPLTLQEEWVEAAEVQESADKRAAFPNAKEVRQVFPTMKVWYRTKQLMEDLGKVPILIASLPKPMQSFSTNPCF